MHIGVLCNKKKKRSLFNSLIFFFFNFRLYWFFEPFVWDGRWLRTLDRNGKLLNPITAFSLNGATTARIGHRSRDVQKAQRIGLHGLKEIIS
jgi:hypothetical protein